MSQRNFLRRIRKFFPALILFFPLILASAVWAEEAVKVPKKETSFWDVVLFPLNVTKIPIYALKYSTKPVVSYIDRHRVLLYWLSGALEKKYPRGVYPAANISGIEGIKGELIFFDNNFFATHKKLKLRLSYSTHDYQNYQLNWGVKKPKPSSLFYRSAPTGDAGSRRDAPPRAGSPATAAAPASLPAAD